MTLDLFFVKPNEYLLLFFMPYSPFIKMHLFRSLFSESQLVLVGTIDNVHIHHNEVFVFEVNVVVIHQCTIVYTTRKTKPT